MKAIQKVFAHSLQEFPSKRGCKYGDDCKFSHVKPEDIPACPYGVDCKFGFKRCAFDHFKEGHECHKTSFHVHPPKKNQKESNAELYASLKGEIEALKDTVADLQRQISEFQKVCPQKQDLPPLDPPSDSLEEEMEVTGDCLEDEMEAKEEQWKNHSWVDNPCP
eukprot:CAMPEP_0117894430 /NCGR_PEP_ID=MMETSP0950-20121206/25949_1 /TAXON_ID=44440 /ORGANISM="Chattonella subsalsa, Strain CCMP2191" /LENGTH=163 /DNA_ID=CAMNT_0005754943 /DNA_START=120 /DNA_END=608 /DNA_ORIENTATION=+